MLCSREGVGSFFSFRYVLVSPSNKPIFPSYSFRSRTTEARPLSDGRMTFLAFRDTHYQQSFGTAMGSPVSVTVANLVMEEIEDIALSTFEHAPKFWKRYVDDTITALPEDNVTHFHSHLNSVNPHIKFTVETESDNCLDILLTHESDGNITTSVYRKPTHTDRYLDFSSHHPTGS